MPRVLFCSKLKLTMPPAGFLERKFQPIASVLVFDTQKHALPQVCHANSLCFSPDGSKIIAGFSLYLRVSRPQVERLVADFKTVLVSETLITPLKFNNLKPPFSRWMMIQKYMIFASHLEVFELQRPGRQVEAGKRSSDVFSLWTTPGWQLQGSRVSLRWVTWLWCYIMFIDVCPWMGGCMRLWYLGIDWYCHRWWCRKGLAICWIAPLRIGFWAQRKAKDTRSQWGCGQRAQNGVGTNHRGWRLRPVKDVWMPRPSETILIFLEEMWSCALKRLVCSHPSSFGSTLQRAWLSTTFIKKFSVTIVWRFKDVQGFQKE